jgi:hypothetical protein
VGGGALFIVSESISCGMFCLYSWDIYTSFHSVVVHIMLCKHLAEHMTERR